MPDDTTRWLGSMLGRNLLKAIGEDSWSFISVDIKALGFLVSFTLSASAKNSLSRESAGLPTTVGENIDIDLSPLPIRAA